MKIEKYMHKIVKLHNYVHLHIVMVMMVFQMIRYSSLLLYILHSPKYPLYLTPAKIIIEWLMFYSDLY